MPYGPVTAPRAPSNVIFGAPLSERGETLKTLQERLVIMLGDRSDLDPIQLADWINDAYIEVATSFDFIEMEEMFRFQMDIDQPFYTMPEGLEYSKSVMIAEDTSESARGGRVLDKIDLDSYRDLPESSAFGMGAFQIPRFYLIWNKYLIIYPTPKLRYITTMDIVVRPQPLVNDTDSPILPVDWHRAILLKAKQQVLEDKKSPQEALIAENSYIKFVQGRSNKKALEKTGRFASVSMPGKYGSYRGYDLGNNSGNPFVDRGSDW
jgi:hypothetical protein